MRRKHLCLAGYTLVAVAAVGCSRTTSLSDPAKTVVQTAPAVQQQVSAAWEADRSGESEKALAMYLEVLASDPNNAWAKRRVEQLSANLPSEAERMIAQAAARPSAPTESEIVAVSAEEPSKARKSDPFSDWAEKSVAPHAQAVTKTEPKAETDDPFSWAREAEAKLAEGSGRKSSIDDEAIFDAIESKTNPFESFVASAAESQTIDEPSSSDASERKHSHEPSWWEKTEEQTVAAAPSEAAGEVTEDVAPPTTEAVTLTTEIKPVAFSEQPKQAIDTVDLSELVSDANLQILSLVERLESPNPSERRSALNELSIMGNSAKTARLPVRVLFDDPSPVVAAEAAGTLWQIDRDAFQSVRKLTTLIHSKNEAAADLAVQSLGLIGPDAISSAPLIRGQLNKLEGVRRVRAAEALVRIEPEDVGALQSLVEATRYGRSVERTEATYALAHTPAVHVPTVTPVLVNALHDENEAVRTAAALTLGHFGAGAGQARLALEAAAKFDTRPVRDAARATLACIPE